MTMRGIILLLFCWAIPGHAHLNNPYSVFEGMAGYYPVRVIIKQPGVVPGLAEIHVRVLTNGHQRVTVLPMHWRAGLEGAPPPDVAQPVNGEPNLYHAELWLMTSGSYSVQVAVDGEQGEGQVVVPVNSVATRRLEMNPWFGGTLLALGSLLLLLMVSIVGASIRESVLEPGAVPSRTRRWFSRGAMVLSLLSLLAALSGGKRWWDAVDRFYVGKRMTHPMQLEVTPRLQEGHRIVRLRMIAPDSGRTDRTRLVPDHGKLMHAFLIRVPELDVFAHLHPVRVDQRRFDAVLPPMPGGDYRVFADVTHETGFSQTMSGQFTVEDAPVSGNATGEVAGDPDDSWHVGAEPVTTLPGGYTMTREDTGPLVAGRDVALRFVVRDADGKPAALKPYLGMFGHAVLHKKSGEVYMHLHPVGTISLAAQQVMALRAQDKDPGIITAETLEPFCKDPPAAEGRRPLEFPALIPEPGDYRLWVQIRPENRVVTVVFDLSVE